MLHKLDICRGLIAIFPIGHADLQSRKSFFLYAGTALKPKKSNSSRIYSTFVFPLCVLLLTGLAGCESEKSKAEKAYQQKYAKAKALFEERCKAAGLVIYRTVKDVEGIELTKVRQKLYWADKRYFDSMFDEAAMAAEVRGDDYIKQFLMYEFPVANRPQERGGLGPYTSERPSKKGYAFVEYIDSKDSQRYRCTPDWSLNHPNWIPGQHHCEPVKSSSTRYALDYEDLVDPADRKFWVAGTKLKVIDKQTGEMIAVFTRFVWDPGFGVSTTGKLPWIHANAHASTRCPSHEIRPLGKDSRYFIDTILIPKQGD
ncbi:MAG: hypothetical protein JNL93_21655 [Pelomonas sp.]|nr:hypothetical protein [Roseateles sp.]